MLGKEEGTTNSFSSLEVWGALDRWTHIYHSFPRQEGSDHLTGKYLKHCLGHTLLECNITVP